MNKIKRIDMNRLIEEYIKKLNRESVFPMDSPHMIKRSKLKYVDLDAIGNKSLHPKELEHKNKRKQQFV